MELHYLVSMMIIGGYFRVVFYICFTLTNLLLYIFQKNYTHMLHLQTIQKRLLL